MGYLLSATEIRLRVASPPRLTWDPVFSGHNASHPEEPVSGRGMRKVWKSLTAAPAHPGRTGAQPRLLGAKDRSPELNQRPTFENKHL